VAGFKLHTFGGVIPRREPRLLPNNAAQVAENVKLFSGALVSWKKAVTVNAPTRSGTLKSMYRMYSTATDYWLTSTSDVDYVRGPIAGDTQFKLYYTGELSTGSGFSSGPRKTNLALATASGTDYPHDWLEMGVPAPGSRPTVIGTGGTSTNSITRTYVYTYVTGTDLQGGTWLEEGPPSPVGTGTGKEDATWVIAALSTGTTGKYAWGGATKNIYHAVTDNAGNTNYQLSLGTVPIATTSTNDTTAAANLGVICPTFTPGVIGSEWVAPPSDLTCLIALPNGIFAGASGNLICFSEPFFPHAWPIRYRQAANFNIVSLGAYGQTVIATTKGPPYALVGARPDSMAMSHIEEIHPCVSKRSTVSFPWGVMWATPDGLALAGVGGAVNAIEPFMKRDEWRTLCFPDSIIAKQFQDVYFGFFQTGTEGLNFIFDKANDQGPLVFGNFDVQGAWTDPESSKMYLMQGGIIKQWDADDTNISPYDWKSKVIVLPKPVNFGAMQIEADFGALNSQLQFDTQSAIDTAINASLLAVDALSGVSVWVGTTSYGTGTTVKSVDGVKMGVCIVSGTSSSVEPTWPQVRGGTATDGTVRWKQVWDVQGATRGAMGEFLLGYYNQLTPSDPFQIGTTRNGWGFPMGASLLQGGSDSTFETRNIQVKVFATTTGTDLDLIATRDITNRNVIRLPRGYKSDQFAIEISGNVSVRYFKIAETAKELGTIV